MSSSWPHAAARRLALVALLPLLAPSTGAAAAAEAPAQRGAPPAGPATSQAKAAAPKAGRPAAARPPPVKGAARKAAAAGEVVVLRVNGTPITRREVDRFEALIVSGKTRLELDQINDALTSGLLQELRRHPERRAEVVKAAGEKRAKILAESGLEARQKAVETALLHEEALKAPPVGLDDLVARALERKRAEFKTAEAYGKSLAAADLTEEELKAFTRREVLIADLVERRFVSAVTIPDQEVEAYYQQHRDGFKTMEESRRMHQVLVGLGMKAATAGQKAAAAGRAARLRERIAAGEPLEQVARQESSCPSAPRGGDIGWVARGQMPPPFERAAFGLAAGALSEVVETPIGYHLLRVDEVKAAEFAPLALAGEKIRAHLRAQRGREAVERWLAERKAQSSIEDVAAAPPAAPARAVVAK